MSPLGLISAVGVTPAATVAPLRQAAAVLRLLVALETVTAAALAGHHASPAVPVSAPRPRTGARAPPGVFPVFFSDSAAAEEHSSSAATYLCYSADLLAGGGRLPLPALPPPVARLPAPRRVLRALLLPPKLPHAVPRGTLSGRIGSVLGLRWVRAPPAKRCLCSRSLRREHRPLVGREAGRWPPRVTRGWYNGRRLPSTASTMLFSRGSAKHRDAIARGDAGARPERVCIPRRIRAATDASARLGGPLQRCLPP